MIYRLKLTEKQRLCSKLKETMIWSCLQGSWRNLCRFADSPPLRGASGDFCFGRGAEPGIILNEPCQNRQDFRILVPGDRTGQICWKMLWRKSRKSDPLCFQKGA